jgi:hypothetical protein
MNNFINRLLSVLSALATVPAAWAIYAGVTEYPTFPMNRLCAILGAAGVISTSIAAGLLVTDIKAYNQTMKNKTERAEFEMSATPAWLIFGGCVLAEITLSLLIVVIPGALSFGVLVFPLMTAAGVFAFAVRYDLLKRESDLLQERKQKATAPKVARKPKQEPVKEPEPFPQVAQLPRKHVKDEDLLAYLASNTGATQAQVAEYFGVTRQAIGPRIKKLCEIKQ